MDRFELTANAISNRNNSYMELYISETGFMYIYPMKSKTDILNAFIVFAKAIGVPTTLILDPEIHISIMYY